MTLTFDPVTQKWVWRLELIKVHLLHMKFQSCRWKHFDFRANVKVLSRPTADEELAKTIPRVFSENSRAKNLAMTIPQVFSENSRAKNLN